VGPRRTRTISPSLSYRLNVAALVFVVLIVVTGGAVRLTDSGLGCANWPECSVGHLVPALHFHRWVEFGNRLVTVVVTIAVGLSFLGTIFRGPRRRDLVWLSGGLVVGVLMQAVLGAIVVYTKLNPYGVMVHFFATMLLLVDAVVLVHRSTREYGPGSGHLLVPRQLLRLFYGVLTLLAVVIAAGTATTGAGPHAGGKGAVRIPVPLSDMARTHAEIVIVLGFMTLAMLYLLDHTRAPERVMARGRILLAVMVAQGIVGYTQYFTRLPALLVGIHVFGVTVLWTAMLWFVDGLFHHPAEEASSGPAPSGLTTSEVPAFTPPVVSPSADAPSTVGSGR
jgi:heme a synthase